MIIQTHWLSGSAQGLKRADVEYIADLCRIPLENFKDHVWDTGTAIWEYAIPGSGSDASIYISVPANPSAYSKIVLTGSFFDYFPDFNIYTLHKFFEDHGGHTKKLDISYIDDEGHLDLQEYKRMSSLENYQSYLLGSTLTSRRKADDISMRGVPDIRQNHPAIYYGHIKSNYVKMYQKQGHPAKFELTVQDTDRVKTLIDIYQPESIEAFQTEARKYLVTAINFVTPSTRNTRKPKQVESYRNFLGGEVAKVRWVDVHPVADVVAESFDSGLAKSIAQLQNFAARFDLLEKFTNTFQQLKSDMENYYYQMQEV